MDDLLLEVGALDDGGRPTVAGVLLFARNPQAFLPGRKDAVRLPASSRGLLLLQRVRDESHRFAIEYQRSLRRRVGLLY